MKIMKTLKSTCRSVVQTVAFLGLLATAANSRAGATYQSVVLGDHPLAYYPLNLATDTNQNSNSQYIATDLSGNGNNGAYVNIYPGYNNVTGPSAYITNGISFDGGSTYVDLSTGSNTALLNFGGQITMEAWVLPASATAGGYIMGEGYDGSQNADENEMRLNNGDFHAGTYNGTTGDRGVTGGTETANWTHLVSTFDGTNWNLYENGALVDSATDTVGAIDFTDPWAIGDGTVSGSTRILSGSLSQVALYNHALTPAQVAAHYFAGMFGNTNPLPNITAQPASAISFPGGTVTFSVSASSSSAITYLWKKNGVSLGQTNATLVLTNVLPANDGSYTVLVSNNAGSTNSAAAILQVGLYGYTPVTLAANSYNEDMIVEKGALIAASTATMDGGTNNNGTTWYETGYDGQPNGLPAAGSTFTSQAQSDHSYIMAPDNTTNDTILIDSSVTHGTFSVTTPAAFSSLSFLASSGNGGMTVAYTVHHANNTTDTGSLSIPDWFSGGTIAWGAGARLDSGSRGLENVGPSGGVPYVYSLDISLANTSSAVTSIDFNWSSGGGHACIFGVSGSTGSGFNPINVTGFNEDMIVAAGAQVFQSGGYTTASVDNGLQNTGFSWYEKGYSTTPWTAPGSGVPPAGSTITNISAASHVYTMAPSYTGVNDVAYVDSSTTANIVPATPQRFYSLSFLTGAGHGPINVSYTVSHTDGGTETGTISAPDWFAGGTQAYIVNGRVDVQSAGLQTWGSGNVVALYSEDVSLADSTAVTNIALSTSGGGDAEVFAVSAISTIVTNLQSTISSVVKNANGSLTLNATGVSSYNYLLQSTTNLASPVWVTISTNAATSGAVQFNLAKPAGTAGFYRTVLVP